jgi:UDP-N-acetylglucosamine 3-dehydrogenase
VTALRAGLLGLGMMGRHHARVLKALDGVELVAVADPVGDLHHVADDLPVHASLERLLAERIDMCVVAVPTAWHEEAGQVLAAAGVHALIEKPLAADTAAAVDLVEAFEKAGLVGCVGHIERFNPALQSLRKRLDDGELGDIYQVATRRQGPFPNRIADVGVIKDLGTHDVDLTAWVTGSPFSAVAARTTHRSGREHEDLVAITGQLQDGTVTNHLVNWLSPMKERSITVTGERGCFVADTLTADLYFHANAAADTTQWEALSRFRGVAEGDMIRYAINKQEPLMTELSAFRDAVRGDSTRAVTMRDGLAAVQVAEAVLASSKSGQTVVLRDTTAAR